MQTFNFIGTESDKAEADRLNHLINQLEPKRALLETCIEVSQFPQQLKSLLQRKHNIRIGAELRDQIFETSVSVPADIVQVRCADTLIFDSKQWWVKCALSMVLNPLLNFKKMALDTSGSVLLLGANSFTRTMMMMVSRWGYKKFTLFELNAERAQAFQDSLQGNFWIGQLQIVGENQVTHLPGVYSFVVNGLTTEEEQVSLNDITYFNFLLPDGIILESKFLSTSEFLDEAKKIGARLINGLEVHATLDAQWLQTVSNENIQISEVLKIYNTLVAT